MSTHTTELVLEDPPDLSLSNVWDERLDALRTVAPQWVNVSKTWDLNGITGATRRLRSAARRAGVVVDVTARRGELYGRVTGHAPRDW